MKIRNGFVTNSSSSSFILSNKGKNILGNEDFARILEANLNEYNEDYGTNYTMDELIERSLEIGEFLLGPGESYQFEASSENYDDIFQILMTHIYDEFFDNGLQLTCLGRNEY